MKKNILITGYPGFLGNYIKEYFINVGYSVYTLGLIKADNPNHIISDISSEVSNLPDIDFAIVVHAAGKAHVRPKDQTEKDLTDGFHPSFNELLRAVSRAFNKRLPQNIPLGIAKFIAKSSDILQNISGRPLLFQMQRQGKS